MRMCLAAAFLPVLPDSRFCRPLLFPVIRVRDIQVHRMTVFLRIISTDL